MIINRIIEYWPNYKNIEYAKDTSLFQPNYGPISGESGRRFYKHNSLDNLELKMEIFGLFGLTPRVHELEMGDITSNHYMDGAFMLPHFSIATTGYAHLRVEVLIKKPPNGGDVIINDKVYQVNEGSCWIIRAARDRRGSTPIYGGERIVYSMGALFLQEELKDFSIND